MADDKGKGNGQAAGNGQAKENRFKACFGSITFKAASPTTKTYDENGRKSRKLATVMVEIGKTAAFVEGKIDAVSVNGGPYKAVFGFFGAQNRGSCIKADDPAAIADLEAYKRHVEAEFLNWRKANGTVTTAVQTAGADLGADFSL